MSEYWGYLITNSSFLLVAIAERLLLLSLLGLIVVVAVSRFYRPRSSGAVWNLYVLWLIPASAPLLPTLPEQWLTAVGLSQFTLPDPCAILPIDRIGRSVWAGWPLLSQQLLLMVLWLGIASALLLRLLYRRWRFARIVAQASSLDDAQWQTMMTPLKHACKIRRPVRLCCSHTYGAPFTIGLWRPAVFLPADMVAQLDADTLRVVLAHELAHIARGDDAGLLLQHIVRALLFFNPATHYTHRKLGAAREMGCDSLAVRRCHIDPRDYGRAMLRVLEYFKATVTRPSPVAGFLNSEVRDRVQQLLEGKGRQRSTLSGTLLAAMALLGISLIVGGTQQPPPSLLSDFRARAVLAPMAPQSPLRGAQLTDGLYLDTPLGCPLPHRDHYHSGIDLKPAGPSSVTALAAGTVLEVMTPAGNIGRLVKIEHGDGVVSTYARLDNTSVEAGQRVEKGEAFASVGATPRTDHLHLEVTWRGQLIDPTALVSE